MNSLGRDAFVFLLEEELLLTVAPHGPLPCPPAPCVLASWPESHCVSVW